MPSSVDVWTTALDLLVSVQQARELRRQRGIGVPVDDSFARLPELRAVRRGV